MGGDENVPYFCITLPTILWNSNVL